MTLVRLALAAKRRTMVRWLLILFGIPHDSGIQYLDETAVTPKMKIVSVSPSPAPSPSGRPRRGIRKGRPARPKNKSTGSGKCVDQAGWRAAVVRGGELA